ncbi:hypothetical protein O988_02078 [Pseudogymnoascus sp. VKM F-3808]|nr:hypothetical protein O988_02078 [Pseudogymnoascus sp. VKM F-3808]
MKSAEKTADLDMGDFEMINGPGDGHDERPKQPTKGGTGSPKRRKGTIYIEAQVKPDYTGSLAKITTKLEVIFRSQCIHAVELDHEMIGEDLYAECFFPDCLHSLKAVDIVGTDDDYPFILVESHTVEINVYSLQDGKAAKTQEALSLCGDAMLLPSVGFGNAFEGLIFDGDIKQKLVVFMTNLLRFSCKPGHSSSSTVNRLVFLSGPPGTGKTSLSIGLAQKLAIRLNKTFGETILLQLNAATLLSQYFGQSAVKIHSIFEALAAQSAETPDTLLVLLIDEIESLAASRETASARNEVHDAVRATNALLTGVDLVRTNANVLIICTSNLSDSLDAAFIDRCGRHIRIPQPALAARYEILRHSINGLIEREIIKTPKVPLPTFRNAEYRIPTDFKTAGYTLQSLAYKLEDTGPAGQVVSARWLSQLAETALADELEPNAPPCTVADALELMSRYVKEVTCENKGSKRSQGTVATEYDGSVKKRKLQLTAGSSLSPVRVTDAHLFGETRSADLEGRADECIATFGEMEAEGYERSPEDIDYIAEKVIDQWQFNGGCCCYEIIGSRLRDYVEHGTPMNRDVSNLYEGSFILEFLEPHPSRDATVLIRATYKHDHPLCKQGKGHPQAPPLHLHFNQSETFQVLQGQVATVEGWSVATTVYTREDGPHEIKPWVPHSFNPVPDSPEDTVVLVWAHPDDVDEMMDRVFFTNLLMYVSDVHEKKVSLNPFQIMLTQHVSATAMIWFPTATWLGPLRWWVPWKVQALFAAAGRLIGLTPMMKRYTSEEEFAEIQKTKRT